MVQESIGAFMPGQWFIIPVLIVSFGMVQTAAWVVLSTGAFVGVVVSEA